jgi:hypothetical protein
MTTSDQYAGTLGFTVHTTAAPAFADVVRGPLRLLLSGPTPPATLIELFQPVER